MTAKLRSGSLLTALLWFAFAAAFILVTAPVWRLWVLGFNPTFDQALQLAVCGGGLPR
jgi:hypothetical protein